MRLPLPKPTMSAGGPRVERKPPEMRGRIDACGVAQRHRFVGGHVFRGDTDEAAREIGGDFRRGRLEDHDVLDLPRRDDVERKGTRIGLGAGDGRAVHPHVVITLREPAGDDELVVDERDARDAAHDLSRVAVLRFADRLTRNAAHDRHGLAHVAVHGHLGTRAAHGRYHHIADLFALFPECDVDPHLAGGGPDDFDPLRFVSDHRDVERIAPGRQTAQRIAAVGAAGGALGRARDEDRRSDDGLSRGGVGYCAHDGCPGGKHLSGERLSGAQQDRRQDGSDESGLR